VGLFGKSPWEQIRDEMVEKALTMGAMDARDRAMLTLDSAPSVLQAHSIYLQHLNGRSRWTIQSMLEELPEQSRSTVAAQLLRAATIDLISPTKWQLSVLDDCRIALTRQSLPALDSLTADLVNAEAWPIIWAKKVALFLVACAADAIGAGPILNEGLDFEHWASRYAFGLYAHGTAAFHAGDLDEARKTWSSAVAPRGFGFLGRPDYLDLSKSDDPSVAKIREGLARLDGRTR
jgi:hypothetical protein